MTHTERALQLRPIIELASQSLDDATALTAKELFPNWNQLVTEARAVSQGFKFRHEDNLYRTEQPSYIFVEHYVPGSTGTESLFSKIDETHAGTIDDPIPYEKNMEIYNGLYYTQNDVLYLCIRDSEQPLYHDLSSLIGLYVEVVS